MERLRDLGHVQADEVRVQGAVLGLAMAIQVQTRLWLGRGRPAFHQGLPSNAVKAMIAKWCS